MYGDDELLALSGLQHISFCERQWALIHIEQQWSESFDTIRGELFHERAHLAGYSCSKGVRSERGMKLVNRELGIYGVADVVEFSGVGDSRRIVPVEYKVGKPKVEDWDRLQVAAQALCLEEMLGVSIVDGALFYGETRKRECVKIEGEIRDRVVVLAEKMHALFSRGVTPRAKKMAKCKRCSLADDCLPSVASQSVAEYWREFGEYPEAAL